jgi:hypothetical protein
LGDAFGDAVFIESHFINLGGKVNNRVDAYAGLSVPKVDFLPFWG